ncbi:MAG: SOS response-associated peptidase [Anaerolineae bacterium]
MCGRFTLWLQFGDLIKAFPDLKFPEKLPPRYNIAPTQQVAVVPNDGDKAIRFFQWGLVPFWAKDPSIGSRMINARSETAAEKPAFRTAYRRRRCLILADGFYEWRKEPGRTGKTPMYVRMASGEPFAFAGLWELWNPDDAPLYSCTILTTRPNALVAPIHNRMPVILPRSAYDRWLDPAEQRAGALDDLLGPYPAEEMTAYPVSRVVNNPSNDVPDCVQPAGPEMRPAA